MDTNIRQKWIVDGGVFYPIDGNARLYESPGTGVFQTYLNLKTLQIGLTPLSERFTFDFKMYDVGCEDIIEHIVQAWNSEKFSGSAKNLGVIFNGIKGTGKTIAAKLLCNRIGLPVIVIPRNEDGLLEFIQGLCFECVILIDETEKTFRKEDSEVLLKLIDGVYNKSRKLYILTTNNLTIDENLIGRPGRIRYIKQFENLSAEVVNAYLDDNLRNNELRENILRIVDSLEISTIDILAAIVDEANIFNAISEKTLLNIPRAKYSFKVLRFRNVTDEQIKDIKAYLKDVQDLPKWLNEPSQDSDEKKDTNFDYIADKWDAWRYTITSQSEILQKGVVTNYGTVINPIDADGYFTLENDSYHEKETSLCRLLTPMSAPSLYRGTLAF